MTVEVQKSPLLRVKDGEIQGVTVLIAECCSAILTHAAILNKKNGPGVIMRGHTLLFPNRQIGDREQLYPNEIVELAHIQTLFSMILKDVFSKDRTEELTSGHDINYHLHTHFVPANRGETDWTLPKEPNYGIKTRLRDADLIQKKLRELGGEFNGIPFILPDNRNLPINQNAK